MKLGNKPTNQLAIFDAYAEKSANQPVKIAEVTVQNGKGRVDVFDPRHEGLVKELFAQPVLVGTGGGVSGGVAADGAPKKLEPFSDAALDHVVKHALPLHQLRAERAKKGI